MEKPGCSVVPMGFRQMEEMAVDRRAMADSRLLNVEMRMRRRMN
jgi:hypothetical protein